MQSLTLTEVALRLLTALVCGGVIGLNRDLRRKPAGFRTFGLVSLGSAVVTLVMLQVPGAGADAASRVVQGILTGIGFLGAGVILHRERLGKIAGLTTAAAIWLTAGLGIASGAGQYLIAGSGLILTLVILILGGPIERLSGKLWGRSTRPNSGAKDDAQPPL